MIISPSAVLRMRSVPNKSYRVNQKTHFTFNKFFPKIVPFIRPNVEKYGTAGQARDDNIIRRRKDAMFMPDN